MKTCAFTGHRPQNLPFGFNEEDERCIDLKKTLREQIINLIENEGVTHFISGMAIGVDMIIKKIIYLHIGANRSSTIHLVDIVHKVQSVNSPINIQRLYPFVLNNSTKQEVLRI